MPYQDIDATLAAADITAVKSAFATILNKLPFLVNLTPTERRAITKIGPNSLSFVQNAAGAAESNPTIFPASFDKDAFRKDVELFTAMTELQTLADSVASQIDDTRLAVGGEAMQAAIQTYNYVKTASKNTAGLKPVAEQLSERFQKVGKRSSKKGPSTTS